MKERYIAFDVETPNSANNRMSAIGICVVEGREIVREYYSLVNPEVRFDRFNIALTGITPEAAAEAPAFPELWPELEELLGSGLLVAHNAPFDISVLCRCLLGYGISWRNTLRYACTCQMGRRFLPELPNHKLDTVSAFLGLELDHHHAGSDSRACGEILLHYLNTGRDPRPYIRTYDALHLRTLRT